MALRQMGAIAERLLAAGRDRAEPVAFITRGNHARQSVVVTTLAEATHAAAAIRTHTPTLIVVGPVVALQSHCCLAKRCCRGLKENVMLPETAPFPADQIVALNRDHLRPAKPSSAHGWPGSWPAIRRPTRRSRSPPHRPRGGRR